MRTGEGVNRISRGFERGPQKRDGRTFAVGPGDVEDRRQLLLWPVDPPKDFASPLQPKPVSRGREHRQPVELRLDAGVSGAREIHDAPPYERSSWGGEPFTEE